MGDESLSARPMERIMAARSDGRHALSARRQVSAAHDQGAKLHPIQYEPPVASANQNVRTFAGVHTEGVTSVVERVITRSFRSGVARVRADVEKDGPVISIQGRPKLEARNLTVPGDLSSAFFLVANCSPAASSSKAWG
jgi:3-phosphoshikimate 1-carboxyvinyltransferase